MFMKHTCEQYPKVFLCLLLTAVTGLAYLPMGDFGCIYPGYAILKWLEGLALTKLMS